LHGDLFDALPTLAAESIDACVTDPPYEIGFMSRKWDRSGVAFDVKTWREVYRVLKPGAYLLAFGGTRTVHRMTCAIEDAGFEIRDGVQWLYGCLSDDTEILVDGQWEPYHKAVAGSRALCYDTLNDCYSWQAIEELYIYNYDDTAYRIHSDHTDQIVSRNHRCLVEHGGAYVFRRAEEIALQREARVPILEDVSGLLDYLSVHDKGTGSTEQIMQPTVRGTTAEKAAKETPVFGAIGYGASVVCRVRYAGLADAGMAETHCDDRMLLSVQRYDARAGMGHPRAQRSCGVDGGQSDKFPKKNDRAEQPCVERRGHVLPETRQLHANQVCALPSGASRDGSTGRLRNGASVVSGLRSGATLDSVRNGASRKSQPAGQSAGEFGAVCEQSRSQTIRAPRYTRTDVARVTPIRYSGIVWCVKVPTGAFVARRNGKVFVTGNSGFPKSRDVSKAIDKEAGAVREVVRTTPSGGYKRHMEHNAEAGFRPTDYYPDGNNFTSNEPITDAAKHWHGWGTALKPSHEPIVVARKPFTGTVAQNVLTHGTGALNIDASRVSAPDAPSEAVFAFGARSRFIGVLNGGKTSAEEPRTTSATSQGRWPANLLLTHAPGCVQTGTKKVKASGGSSFSGTRQEGVFDTGLATRVPTIYGQDGVEEVELWQCVEGCPVAVLDAQSGVTSSGSRKVGVRAGLGYGSSAQGDHSPPLEASSGGASRFFNTFAYDDLDTDGFLYCAKPSGRERDAGGCRNTHPTVKPVSLMRWLVRLVTPAGGTVLDPFAGSGTTGMACQLEHRDFTGIEKEAVYVSIAERRIASVLNSSEDVLPLQSLLSL